MPAKPATKADSGLEFCVNIGGPSCDDDQVLWESLFPFAVDQSNSALARESSADHIRLRLSRGIVWLLTISGVLMAL
jgi:hypothetical protein